VFLTKHKTHIDAVLAELLPLPATTHQLFDAMRYSVLNNNSKRLRPALVYATGQALGTKLTQLHGAAASVELIHCYSLVHDDLPAMDNDDLRRGMATCHKAFNETIAILVGDALQARAFEVLADNKINPTSSQQQIHMISTLAKAVGANGMVLGQALDMHAVNKTMPTAALIELHLNKTGALLRAAVELATIASDCNDQTLINNLHNFATNIGLAFQIHDDILDVTGTDQMLGKPAKSDQQQGKATFPAALGLEKAKQYAYHYYQTAIAALTPLQGNADLLIQLADFFIKRKY